MTRALVVLRVAAAAAAWGSSAVAEDEVRWIAVEALKALDVCYRTDAVGARIDEIAADRGLEEIPVLANKVLEMTHKGTVVRSYRWALSESGIVQLSYATDPDDCVVFVLAGGIAPIRFRQLLIETFRLAPWVLDDVGLQTSELLVIAPRKPGTDQSGKLRLEAARRSGVFVIFTAKELTQPEDWNVVRFYPSRTFRELNRE